MPRLRRLDPTVRSCEDRRRIPERSAIVPYHACGVTCREFAQYDQHY